MSAVLPAVWIPPALTGSTQSRVEDSFTHGNSAPLYSLLPVESSSSDGLLSGDSHHLEVPLSFLQLGGVEN